MIVYRRSEERGHTDKGWLDSIHTFSFTEHKDPKHNGFRRLRVAASGVPSGVVRERSTAISEGPPLTLNGTGKTPSEVMLFDLA